MSDSRNRRPNSDHNSDVSRRQFGAMSVGAVVAVAAAGASGAPAAKERNVEIKTADGSCDAFFVHPASGTHAAVIVWPDAFGLRPSMQEIGRRLAGDGYAALVVNPYYRISKAPQFSGKLPDFAVPEQRALIMNLMGKNTPEGAVVDSQAFVKWLDSQAVVNKSRKIGVQGYCMGGALCMRTAAAVPDRIGAVGSFHGGGLVSDNPNSIHLLIPKMKAQFLIAIAENDDKNQPDAKDKLKAAFAAAKLKAEVEVYAAQHGWCVRDMNPRADGMPIFDMAQAERAWARLLVLYKEALA
jgi:carboxymethylenebutenolidase